MIFVAFRFSQENICALSLRAYRLPQEFEGFRKSALGDPPGHLSRSWSILFVILLSMPRACDLIGGLMRIWESGRSCYGDRRSRTRNKTIFATREIAF